MLRVALVVACAACGAQLKPDNLAYEPSSSASQRGRIERVTLACIGAGAFVPCDSELSTDDPLVAIYFEDEHGRRWPATRDIALNDIELASARTLTIDGEPVPVFALADAFPEVRRGTQLPPARYRLRVQVISVTGPHTMIDQELVLR